jgi:prolipoprotein diacylglyceryl transferase
MISYIIWNANPEIFSFLPIRWYGLLFALGFIISQQVMYYIYRKEGKSEKDIDTITIYMIIATIIGARLGHIFFYEPDILLERPWDVFLPVRFTPEFKFVGLQGLASHGGAFGILFALWLYSNYDITFKKFKFKANRITRPGQNYLQVVDKIVIVVALTGCLIRFGNFVNSEIVGKPTDAGYGVVFARNATASLTGNSSPIETIKYQQRDREPNELGYQPISMTLTFKNGNYTDKNIKGYLEGSFRNLLNNNQYVSENIYHDSSTPLNYQLTQSGGVFIANVDVYGIARHPAQLYESISCLIIFVMLFAIWSIKKADTAPGRILGVFLIILFGLRFVYEFLKENQVSFEDNMSLNMGQWLSIPLVLAGIVILMRSFKTSAISNN